MKKKPNLKFDSESYKVLQGKVEVGEIKLLSDEDVAEILPHIPRHLETCYVAASGVPPSESSDCLIFDQEQIAIEWVRYENKPQPNEPEINTYRFVLGIDKNGQGVGYDVTRPDSGSGQVADHWTTVREVTSKHFS